MTGSSRGLGRATAIELGRRGWRVCVNFRRNAAAAAETVHAILGCEAADAFAFEADVCSRAAVGDMFAECIRRWGAIDLLVNNAGIARASLLPNMTEPEWDEVIGVDFTGALNCCREAARLMMQTGRGHIINISSIAGLRGRAGQSHYAAAKGALAGLSRQLAAELGPAGVRVNAVLPGYLPTDMGLASPDAARQAAEEHCLGRLGDVDETARFIADLAEMQSVTGQVLRVDGRI